VRNLSAFLSVALCLFVLSGCSGDGRLNAKGRIVKGGAPFTVAEGECVRVIFFPVTSDGQPPHNTYIAAYKRADGTFRAVGPDGKGIPPGKYRIALEHLKKKQDLFRGTFDGERSPIVREVTDGSNEIVIDLDHPAS
jgi:hypothetical protein